jgi:molybdenum cofactor cytidylyltransferase
VIGLIVLAAGQASRLGLPKLLLPVQGRTLLRFTTERLLASPVDATVVVLGAQADVLADELAGLPVRVVVNARYAEGLSTSLQTGLHALPPDTEAAVIALADQPLVTADIVRALVERYVETRRPIIYPSYAGQQGNPVLFARQLFPDLLALKGDAGARHLIRARTDEALAVPFATTEPLRDVDTWEDYEAVRRALGDDPHEQAPAARFCARCGAAVAWRLVERRLRPACARCGAVVYEDPKVAVVALIEQDGRLLLAQRAHDPGKGLWSFPGGFVDRGEQVERALEREVWEETGLQISLGGLLGIYSRPGHPVIVIAYRATPAGGTPRPSSEAQALAFFAPDALPAMAFGADDRILADWRQARAAERLAG